VWADLVTEYGERVELIEYDREKSPGKERAGEFGIFYQPAFVVLDADGEVVVQKAGINNEAALRELIVEYALVD
jgi:hypothetical protein